jgi:hypothetical protein
VSCSVRHKAELEAESAFLSIDMLREQSINRVFRMSFRI